MHYGAPMGVPAAPPMSHTAPSPYQMGGSMLHSPPQQMSHHHAHHHLQEHSQAHLYKATPPPPPPRYDSGPYSTHSSLGSPVHPVYGQSQSYTGSQKNSHPKFISSSSVSNTDGSMNVTGTITHVSETDHSRDIIQPQPGTPQGLQSLAGNNNYNPTTPSMAGSKPMMNLTASTPYS